MSANSAQVEGGVDDLPPTAGASSGDAVMVVEGIILHDERKGWQGHGYSGKRLVCPAHKNCRKSRHFGVKACDASKLEDLEVPAFLGCWYKLGKDLASGDEHKAFKPTTAQVVEYAKVFE